MDKKRKVYAPFSLTSEAGVAQTPVEGYIDVIQTVFPSVNTGTINENGTWAGVKSDDTEFFGFTKHVAVANGATTLSPDTGNINNIDMSGFKDIIVAIKASRAGNYSITAVQGPDTNRFYNLEPVDAAATLRMFFGNVTGGAENMANDSVEVLTADVWEVWMVQNRVGGMKNLQFRVDNDSGGEADIEVAFLRLV